MPSIRQQRDLPYSAEAMFDLVADVESYPQFLPWVTAIRVRKRTASELLVDMVVGFKGITERFTSRVALKPFETIEVTYVDGPLRELNNSWRFLARGAHACTIAFAVDFRFRSRIFEMLAGQYVDRAFNKMVAAFEARAATLYGAPAGAETSA